MQSIALQYLLVALALLWSVGYLIARQFPLAVRALRRRCALHLLARAGPVWQRRLGRLLAPPAATPTICAAAGTCGGCDKSADR